MSRVTSIYCNMIKLFAKQKKKYLSISLFQLPEKNKKKLHPYALEIAAQLVSNNYLHRM